MAIRRMVALGMLLLAFPVMKLGAQDARFDLLDWVEHNASPLHTIELDGESGDLAPLKKAIGSARVVAFSEGWHQAHEFLAFRNRLFAYLVENAGVTAYAGETGFTDAVAVDDYILGRTPYTDEVARAVFAWEKHPIEENRELVEWLRAYNARPTTQRAVRFYGVDLTGGALFRQAPLAVNAVLKYLERVDAEQARRLGAQLLPWMKNFNAEGYASIAAQDQGVLTISANDLVRLFESNRIAWVERSSRLEFERAYRNAVVMRQINDMFRTTLEQNLPPTYSHRGPGMSENLRWALEQEGPQGRVFLFAQVGHVEKTRIGRPRPPMGAYLHSLLGGDYVAIGGLWAGGLIGRPGRSRPLPPMSHFLPPMRAGVYGPLDEVLAKVDGALYFLDLRGMPLLPSNLEFGGRAEDHFDAVVFFRTVSPLHSYAR